MTDKERDSIWENIFDNESAVEKLQKLNSMRGCIKLYAASTPSGKDYFKDMSQQSTSLKSRRPSMMIFDDIEDDKPITIEDIQNIIDKI